MCKQTGCCKRDLQEYEKKGEANRWVDEGIHLRSGIPPPPRFCTKRLQATENKRQEVQKERQEISRGAKLLKARELLFERRTGWERLVRGNTRKHSTSLRYCQFRNDKHKRCNGLRSQLGRNNEVKIRTLKNQRVRRPLKMTVGKLYFRTCNPSKKL